MIGSEKYDAIYNRIKYLISLKSGEREIERDTETETETQADRERKRET